MNNNRVPRYASTMLLVLVLIVAGGNAVWAEQVNLPGMGDYEIYTLGKADKAQNPSKLWPETPRQGLNEDGLVGLFVAETADKLKPRRMFAGAQFYYSDLTSRRGTTYHSGETGSLQTLKLSVDYLGDWAEWSVSVPVHSYSLSAPRTYSKLPQDSTGLGNLKLAWKATYLPDRSYYRFAYGTVIETVTGDPKTMWPASKPNDELKIFGCVTTKETDFATGNLELGAIIDSGGNNNRFLYRLGLSYEATKHATFIGELAGEVQGGNDKDTLDLVTGIRLSPSGASILELQYTKNLRTYREFGWDDRLSAGFTIRW
ncbi:MAG: hypothetical protein HQM09_19870 [Candidatus Riflebacteria bacterium]|nr:hypothetical protein [Candidatus Riflebacteria bacterium]